MACRTPRTRLVGHVTMRERAGAWMLECNGLPACLPKPSLEETRPSRQVQGPTVETAGGGRPGEAPVGSLEAPSRGLKGEGRDSRGCRLAGRCLAVPSGAWRCRAKCPVAEIRFVWVGMLHLVGVGPRRRAPQRSQHPPRAAGPPRAPPRAPPPRASLRP